MVSEDFICKIKLKLIPRSLFMDHSINLIMHKSGNNNSISLLNDDYIVPKGLGLPIVKKKSDVYTALSF